eukprot:1157779-Pelagomonas_calceolata.AAC.11
MQVLACQSAHEQIVLHSRSSLALYGRGRHTLANEMNVMKSHTHTQARGHAAELCCQPAGAALPTLGPVAHHSGAGGPYHEPAAALQPA